MSDIFNQALAGKRGKHQQLIAEAVAREWGELLLKKNHDYGSAIFAPPVLAPDIPASLAIQVRLSDKLSRIKNLLDNPAEVSEESIDDSMLDYAAYRLLQRIAKRLESPELSDVAGVLADDPPAKEAAEDAPREIAYIDGVPYAIPDERDIGAVVAVSDDSHKDAILSGPNTETLLEVERFESQAMFIEEDCSCWAYAVLPEPVPRKTFTYSGNTYEIPDGRDIGKLARVSDMSSYAACLNPVCIRIANYRPNNERPYVSASGLEWEYAVLVPEVPSDA